MLVSSIQQSDLYIYIIYIYICILFKILFHYRLLQVIDYSSLCYMVGPCCLPILYILMRIFGVCFFLMT